MVQESTATDEKLEIEQAEEEEVTSLLPRRH